MASCLVSWTIMIAVLVASSARADDLIVFSSGAPADAQKSIAADSMPPQSKPVFTVAMPAALLAKLAAGEKADVLVMPEQALAGLEAAGRLAPSRRVAVARVGVGVVVRQGAAVPDVGTVDALRAALIAAPSVVYPDPASEGSVAGRAINRMLTEMGIAAALAPKTTLRHAITGGVEMVARGEVALGLFNISEILPIKGITLAGPLPREVQSYIIFAAAITASSPRQDAARTYIRRLGDAAVAKHWTAAGLEPIATSR